MATVYPIYTEQTECQDCYKCIRRCPVKAIRVENSHAKIMPERCIACGGCVRNCPSHAKRVRDDKSAVKRLLSQKKKVYASLAPSFVSEFSDFTTGQMVAALKRLGFSDVSETAIGADLVSAQVAEDLALAEKACSKSGGKTKTSKSSASKSSGKNFQKLFLSSACPAVVEYIKVYLPEFAPYITDRASPLLAHSRFLRKVFGKDIGVVFIGPCIAKKCESDTWKEIDAALTFQELRAIFETEGIRSDALGNDGAFVPRRAAKGAAYPIDGGMIVACKKYEPLSGVRSMSISGIEEIHDALEGLDIAALKEPLFMELLSCRGGCVNGPGTEHGVSTAMKRVYVADYASTADDKLDDETLAVDIQIKDTLPVEDAKPFSHSEEEIKTALRSVGKYSASDEMNCGSCGYETCRGFAEAILDNRAEKTMCVSYMRKLAQKKANGLIQAIPSGVVIADKNLQIVECNMNFAQLMGQDAVELYEMKPGLEGADLERLTTMSRFFRDVLASNGPDIIEKDIQDGKNIFHVTVFEIEKGEIAGGVIEDITAPQSQKTRTVTQAKKIIDKNLSVVQQIAFLLGENAAETEAMLNSIIKSYDEDEEDV